MWPEVRLLRGICQLRAVLVGRSMRCIDDCMFSAQALGHISAQLGFVICTGLCRFRFIVGWAILGRQMVLYRRPCVRLYTGGWNIGCDIAKLLAIARSALPRGVVPVLGCRDLPTYF